MVQLWAISKDPEASSVSQGTSLARCPSEVGVFLVVSSWSYPYGLEVVDGASHSIHRRGASKCATYIGCCRLITCRFDNLSRSRPMHVQGTPRKHKMRLRPLPSSPTYMSTYLGCPWKIAHRDAPGLVLIGGEALAVMPQEQV